MQRNKVRQTIGIDINETEICVTQVQGTWPDPQVIKIDSEPIPHNSIKNSEVINADIIAETLRQLIDRMELNTKSAVMSIPSRQVVTRILDIPNVPDPEMKALLDMEVSHQHILREEDGVYAHTNLPTTIKGRDESRQILVMASEESTLSKYREIANKAGIYLIGLEPATVAMARIASITTHARQSALCLYIGATESEISIVEHGTIRLYRRIDTGSNQMISPLRGGGDRHADGSLVREKIRMARSLTEAPVSDEVEVEVEGGEAKLPFDTIAANGLMLEVQRSLDYYRRESPEAGIVSSVTMVCDRPDLEPFARWLSQSLQLEVVIAGIKTESQPEFNLLHLLQPPHSMRYLTSIGLAMRFMAGIPDSIPNMDLLGQVVMERTEIQTRNKFTFALMASVAILFAGMIASYMVGLKANNVGQELAHLKQDMDRMQRMKSVKIEEIQHQRDLMVRLKVEGLPIPRIMDAIASAVPSNLGILDISVNKTGTVTISGEAMNDRDIIQMLEALKREPLLKSTSLDSFDSSNQVNTNKHKIVKFQVSAQIANVKLPADVDAAMSTSPDANAQDPKKSS